MAGARLVQEPTVPAPYGPEEPDVGPFTSRTRRVPILQEPLSRSKGQRDRFPAGLDLGRLAKSRRSGGVVSLRV